MSQLKQRFLESIQQLPLVNMTVVVGDTVQQALGKLQAQFTAIRIMLEIRNNKFAALLKFETIQGQELRADEGLNDRYHGVAVDGTPETAASWAVVRFYKDAFGTVVRVRYRENIRWSERTLGW